jgi:ABC-2 type transport system permease protein
LIAKRDYIASVRTKSFLIGLILFPMIFGGGALGVAIMKAKPDVRDRHVALLDRSEKLTPYVIDAVSRKNGASTDAKTGFQTSPKYVIDAVAVNADDPAGQRLALCDRIRKHELFGFVDLPADVLHPAAREPRNAPQEQGAGFYSATGSVDRANAWMGGALNDAIYTARLAEAGVNAADAPALLKAVNLDNMTLVERDPKTGSIRRPVKQNDFATFALPFGAMTLLSMVVMVGAAPMMAGVTEDKSQRIIEMLLGMVTPFDLMTGKVIAGVARSLTGSLLYVTGATVVLLGMNVAGLAPLAVLPWFYVYLLAEVTLLCAMASALGAACNTPQEAGNLVMIILAPVMIPFFLIAPITNNPNGAFATAISLCPPFTPTTMILRQMMPGGVPAWQPWVGLLGTIVFTIFVVWGASRVFRIAILMQGQPVRMKTLAQWAIRG